MGTRRNEFMLTRVVYGDYWLALDVNSLCLSLLDLWSTVMFLRLRWM